ncbi:transporter substrate-binding domain-containing protein [Ectopseudomonas mendocina]|uniref:Transporter substrate-binding domain-containing protein n=1 Tax=Ectopseudomonas mendocina TaxID=300 RepID=A0ABZ2RHN6_ECTME
MGRGLVWLVLTLAVWQFPFAHANTREQINVASEHWPDYTQSDGQGLAWDILRLVYGPLDIELVVHSVPHTRAMGLAKRGELDAFAGSYLYEVRKGIHYPEMYYDFDVVAALGLKSSPVPELETLKDYRLAWPRGYQYQRYLPATGIYREISRSSNVLSMLEMRHTDFFLDDLSELEHVLAEASDRSRYKVTPLIRLPVYVGFSDTPKGKRLADVFDQRMKVLIADGSLRPVFKRWKQMYPFD